MHIYNQNVSDQFYPYIRPQENGNKTDIRWWKQVNMAGNGPMPEKFHSKRNISVLISVSTYNISIHHHSYTNYSV